MGHKALSKVQIGQETVQGTAVPADIIWRGPFAGLKDARDTQKVEEDIGIAMKSSRKYAAMLLAEMSFPVTPLTPEQAPHIMEAAIKQVNTGVVDGTASSGYVYDYPFGTTTINTISTYTIESGDEDQAEEAEFCFVKSFTISAVKGEVVQISSEWAGRQVADTTFTPALSAVAVSHIHASNGSVYIDDSGGTFGTTSVAAGNLLEFTLNVNSGRVPLFTADSGNLYFVGEYFNIDEVEVELEMKWIHDTAALAERTKWRANDERLVRIEFTGDDYVTPGTGTDLDGKKGIQIDFPGSYDEFTAVEHEEGKSIITATLSGGYESVNADVFALRLYNEDTTLT